MGVCSVGCSLLHVGGGASAAICHTAPITNACRRRRITLELRMCGGSRRIARTRARRNPLARRTFRVCIERDDGRPQTRTNRRLRSCCCRDAAIHLVVVGMRTMNECLPNQLGWLVSFVCASRGGSQSDVNPTPTNTNSYVRSRTAIEIGGQILCDFFSDRQIQIPLALPSPNPHHMLNAVQLFYTSTLELRLNCYCFLHL